MTLKASVILPTFQDWPALAGCLEALSAQDLPASDFEVIIANNNPDAALPDSLTLGSNMRIVWEPKPGSYAARNAALRDAAGDIIFFTDADCRPAPEWLSRGLNIFRTHPGCRRVAGRIAVEPTSNVWNGWSVYDAAFNLRQEDYVRRGFAVTANLAVERKLFDEVGSFREDTFSGEDKDWNRRASRAGVPLIYDDAMWVLHPARETFAECAQKRRRLAGARYVAKTGSPIARRIPRLHYVLPDPFAYADILRAPVSAHLGARLKAMWCHYALGWVYNTEIVRLSFGGVPGRS